MSCFSVCREHMSCFLSVENIWGFFSVCREHMSCFSVGLSGASRRWVRYFYQEQWMCFPPTDWIPVCCFITYYTFDVDLMAFYLFTLETSLYKRSHSRISHNNTPFYVIKRVIVFGIAIIPPCNDTIIPPCNDTT